MKAWLIQHLTSAALALASLLILLEITVLPPFIDFLSDCVLWGLIAAVGYMHKGKEGGE